MVITLAAAVERLREGNARFVGGTSLRRDLRADVRQTATQQSPFAAILTCIDSRVAPEIVFDQGVGDLLVARVAGNVVTDDIAGSLELAAAVLGAKLIVVMGHSDCGAIQQACAGTGDRGLASATLARLRRTADAVPATDLSRKAADPPFVRAVAEANARVGMDELRSRSAVLRTMIERGEIGLVGAMYDVGTGRASFLE